MKGAVAQYTKVLEGIEPTKYTDTQITALRHRVIVTSMRMKLRRQH